MLGLELEGDRFPERGQQAPQYVLEELLRDVVDELDACTLAVGHRVVGLTQEADHVVVETADADGMPMTITADYVVGGDGPRSTVRAQIGSDYVGEHALRPNYGMVFDAPDLWDHVRHGPAVQYWTVNPDAPALLGPLDRTAPGGSSPSASTVRRATASSTGSSTRRQARPSMRPSCRPTRGRHGCSWSTVPAAAACSSPATPPTSTRPSVGTA